MKTIITTLNAKFIHQSLAIRLLYIANREEHDVDFLEFNINESLDSVAQSILTNSPEVVALGVYIWNVEESRSLITRLKSIKPSLKIIVGGPEVTYEPDFFLENWEIDYVISGEGEFVLGELLCDLSKGNNTEKIDIPGVSTRSRIRKEIIQVNLEKLALLPSPYTLPQDADRRKDQIIYVETSRGCPYQCQYCLSSLEVGVRYFPQEYIFNNLKALIDSDAKQIKFLDRTFNLNKKHTQAIFNFLIGNYRPGLSCQFEIYADILTSETIEYLNTKLPENYFRFEIGIQSTHTPTNDAVKRKQDFELLSQNIKHIMAGGKIDLHLDLIAGLPFETFALLTESFNEVFAFRAQELQLGFLKLLRGTNLRNNADSYGYKYLKEAPYEVVSNNWMSAEELERVRDVEKALDKYWNSGKFKRTMNAVFDDHYNGKYFEFFDELGKFYQNNNISHRGYQLEEIFKHLHNFLCEQRIDLTNIMRQDYYDCFPQRPNNSFLPRMDKGERRKITNIIMSDREFLTIHNISAMDVRKYSELDLVAENRVIITVFSGIRGVNKRIEYNLDS